MLSNEINCLEDAEIRQVLGRGSDLNFLEMILPTQDTPGSQMSSPVLVCIFDHEAVHDSFLLL